MNSEQLNSLRRAVEKKHLKSDSENSLEQRLDHLAFMPLVKGKRLELSACDANKLSTSGLIEKIKKNPRNKDKEYWGSVCIPVEDMEEKNLKIDPDDDQFDYHVTIYVEIPDNASNNFIRSMRSDFRAKIVDIAVEKGSWEEI